MKVALNPFALALTAGLLFSLAANASPALEQQVGQDPATPAFNHNPEFFVDEGALVVGTGAMATMVVDYLSTADWPPVSRRSRNAG